MEIWDSFAHITLEWIVPRATALETFGKCKLPGHSKYYVARPSPDFGEECDKVADFGRVFPGLESNN